ncbi:hypothetical protein [Streptomyces sp. NBC_00470]|uniref:hypothetical protein n=1 Tax=Streptomyces sp. NBC_00470 TaxID=2975753 RepID=UPI0030E10F0F
MKSGVGVTVGITLVVGIIAGVGAAMVFTLDEAKYGFAVMAFSVVTYMGLLFQQLDFISDHLRDIKYRLGHPKHGTQFYADAEKIARAMRENQ